MQPIHIKIFYRRLESTVDIRVSIICTTAVLFKKEYFSLIQEASVKRTLEKNEKKVETFPAEQKGYLSIVFVFQLKIFFL